MWNPFKELFEERLYFIEFVISIDYGLDLRVSSVKPGETLPPTAVTKAYNTFHEAQLQKNSVLVRLASQVRK